MDAAAFTSLVMGILTPLVSDIGNAIAADASSVLLQQGKKLYEAIRRRFAQEADGGKASQALQTFVDDPDYSSVVEKKLFHLLQSDSSFADALYQIIQAGPRQELTVEEEAKATNIRMSNTLGKGNQTIKGGKRSMIEDVGMNIKHD